MLKKAIWWLAVVCILLDGVTTLVALESPHLGEGNDRMKNLMEEFGTIPAMMISMVARLFLVGVGYAANRIMPAEGWVTWMLPIAVLTPSLFAVVNNLIHIALFF